jgi:MOSC domain-containing protein YiiM
MEMKELFSRYNQDGVVTWIGVRPDRRVPMAILDEVTSIEGNGLEGDRHKSKGARQVTLIQHEHLIAVASILAKDQILPESVRRNIVVRGINLISLKGKLFQIGQAIFEYSGECHPCSRMEENLGEGGYNAMRGHGGITAKVIRRENKKRRYGFRG